jgi:preprotein translocase subunit YajC
METKETAVQTALQAVQKGIEIVNAGGTIVAVNDVAGHFYILYKEAKAAKVVEEVKQPEATKPIETTVTKKTKGGGKNA